jgi:anti-sigma regulatory factor (Ser/Thr protein kinase)
MIPAAISLMIPVAETSQAGEARRSAASLSHKLGLDEVATGKVAVLVTELANNLHKHAREGCILLRAVEGATPGLEILAVDKGPGMGQVEKCFRDGFSTSGTPGTGLGAVARMADRYDVYSVPGAGTVLVAQVGGAQANGASARLEIGSVNLPLKGETECGDNWAHIWNGSRDRIMMADGLGHGVHAAEASRDAETIFREKERFELGDVMAALHNGLKKTRGAALSIAEIDWARQIVRYMGVGNIAATIIHEGKTRSLVSLNGIVGHEMRKTQEFQYPFPSGALLAMNSDGLLTKWDVSKSPGLTMRHPSLIAASLWRDFTRGRDDVTVIVARERLRA